MDDTSTSFIELTAATGSIQAGDAQQERLEEITQRLATGEFHAGLDWAYPQQMIIARCKDGRSPEETSKPLVPNAAGGTESLLIADDLTTKRFAAPDGTTASAYRSLLTFLLSKNYVVGGHFDETANEEISGCGANDKLEAIYSYIGEHNATLRQLTETILGQAISEEVHNYIVENARGRTAFSSGHSLLTILKEEVAKTDQGELFIDRLLGPHKEVVAIINKRPNTTLDRLVLATEFGSDYQAFNVDVWAFSEAAIPISDGQAEAEQKVIAMMYYNLATTMVLTGPKMRVIIIPPEPSQAPPAPQQ